MSSTFNRKTQKNVVKQLLSTLKSEERNVHNARKRVIDDLATIKVLEEKKARIQAVLEVLK